MDTMCYHDHVFGNNYVPFLHTVQIWWHWWWHKMSKCDFFSQSHQMVRSLLCQSLNTWLMCCHLVYYHTRGRAKTHHERLCAESFPQKSRYPSVLEGVCEIGRHKTLTVCSCLPRECSQTMFIVLGGFQGEWAGNDGSWSPGEVDASKEDAGMWTSGWGKENRNKKRITWHVGRRDENNVCWSWKRVIIHAHAEIGHTKTKVNNHV